ncbi:MAG: TIGR03621 family F420-dependent LLM class oxidoreductase [Acidimicrobiia bacterium]
MTAFRFGFQVTATRSVDALRAEVQRAEAAGFDIVHVSDHVGSSWAPFALLQAMAAATTHIRVGSLVLNNDFYQPVGLAREVAAVDHLSGGRVELGMGAGHAFTEYQAIGVPFDPPAVRKARLAESVEIVRALLDGEAVTRAGRYYQLEGARTMRSLQTRLPILVGVNGRAALTHAAAHADTIGLTMLGRTLEDGQRHEARWEADRIDRTVAHIRDAAADRTSPVELNALIQATVVTDDRAAVTDQIAKNISGLTADDALRCPFLAIGTHDEIADHLWACRQRWGISYFSVRSIDEFAPVIEKIRTREPPDTTTT